MTKTIENELTLTNDTDIYKITDRCTCFGEVPTFLFSTRFGLAVLGFFGFLAMHSQRVAIDLALPCMLNHSATRGEEPPVSQGQLGVNHKPRNLSTSWEGQANLTNLTFTANASLVQDVELQHVKESSCGGSAIELDILKLKLNFSYSTETGELVWPVTRQNVLASTFYWGYTVAFLPCGWMAERLGGKLIMGLFIGAMSATTSLVSLSTTTHYFVLILLRFIAGLGAGACLPAMYSVWGKWAPPLERSKLVAITYSGLLIGRCVTFPLVGALCQYGFLGGWPSVFYVLGAYGFIWTILWMVFTKDFPNQHPRISLTEKRYLEATLIGETILHARKDISVPCFSIVTSLPFISVMVSHFTYTWTLNTYEVYIPLYFSEILDYEYRGNGFFNMIPYLGIALFLNLSGMWADQLRSRGVMGTAAARKIMNTIGTSVPAAMLIGLGFINCTQWIGAVCMLTIGMTFLGFQGSGFLVNHLDLAPQYAGFLMGVSGGIASLAVFIEPYLVETLTPEHTHEQWQTVFFISGCLALVGGLCFLFCGSGEVQSWAVVRDNVSSASTPNISMKSSTESLDGTLKTFSNKKYNSFGLPQHCDVIESQKKEILARSLSEDSSKRYSTPPNGLTYDDPYFFQSLDRGSRKKLLASNSSYRSLDYPSHRYQNVTPELRKLKALSVQSPSIEVEQDYDEEAVQEVGLIHRNKQSIERKTSDKGLYGKHTHPILQRSSSNKSRGTVQDDPPSADRPSTSSSGDSQKKPSRQARKAKRTRSATLPQSEHHYETISESKV